MHSKITAIMKYNLRIFAPVESKNKAKNIHHQCRISALFNGVKSSSQHQTRKRSNINMAAKSERYRNIYVRQAAVDSVNPANAPAIRAGVE